MTDQILQFTQEDRDRLIRMDERLGNFLENQSKQRRRLSSHHRRITSLERTRDEGRGAIWALRWLWAAIAATLGLFGWHITAGHK